MGGEKGIIPGQENRTERQHLRSPMRAARCRSRHEVVSDAEFAFATVLGFIAFVTGLHYLAIPTLLLLADGTRRNMIIKDFDKRNDTNQGP